MPFGIDSTGFVPKPLDTIKTDLEGGFRTVFGAAITTVAQSVFGQLIGIFSERLADAWQLGLATYNASFREGATGIHLDNIGALTGTARLQASYTKVDLTLTGVAATVIPALRVVSIPSTGAKFTNVLGGVIGGGGTVVIEFRAVETGPQTAYAGTVTNIETPVAGWTSVTNATDHKILGTNIETDAAYRLRQEQELRAQGQSTIAAIRAKIFTVANVTEAYLFENVTDTTDANGLPPHSFESVVLGGTDADVAKVIADSKPVGIATHGLTTQATTDANGFSLNIKFSRPQALNIYVVMTATVNPAVFPSNGADLIKAAVVSYGDTNYRVGSEVRSSALLPSVFAATSGILECTLPFIGTAPAPVSSTTINVNNRQLADLDTSRITVNLVYVVPS